MSRKEKKPQPCSTSNLQVTCRAIQNKEMGTLKASKLFRGYIKKCENGKQRRNCNDKNDTWKETCTDTRFRKITDFVLQGNGTEFFWIDSNDIKQMAF